MRWIIRLLAIVLLMGGIVGGGVLLLPQERLAAIAVDQISRATGRAVRIRGEIKPSFYPELGVRTGPVEIAAPDWAEEGPLLTAEALSVGVDLAALWRGTVEVGEVAALSPRIVLERAADGRASWAGPQTGTGAAAPGPQRFTLQSLVIRDAALIFVDKARGTRTEGTDIDIEAHLPRYDGPLDFAMSGRINGQAVQAEGQLGAFGPFVAGQGAGLTAETALGTASLAFKGTVRRDGRISGRIATDVTDLASILAAAQLPPADLPQGLRERLAATGQLDIEGDRAFLTGAALALGRNGFRGDVAVALGGDRPKIAGDLVTEMLDLTPFGSGPSTAPKTGNGWSEDAIEASGLSVLNASVSLTAKAVTTGDLSFGPSSFEIELDRSRLVLGMDPLSGFGGTVRGQLVANNRNGLSVGGDLMVEGVRLEELLDDLAGTRRVQGPATAELEFLAVGDSVAQIVASLSGQARIAIGKGSLTGIDLVALFQRGAGTEPGAITVFDSLDATFSLQNGQMLNEDLALSAQLFRASGKGRLDLVRQRIDYTITPQVGAAEGIAVPVRIDGPWSGPRIYPDLEAVAAIELAREREKLEAAAAVAVSETTSALRERATEEAEQVLGTELEEGENLEDAARRKLGEEARKGLGRLLGSD